LCGWKETKKASFHQRKKYVQKKWFEIRNFQCTAASLDWRKFSSLNKTGKIFIQVSTQPKSFDSILRRWKYVIFLLFVVRSSPMILINLVMRSLVRQERKRSERKKAKFHKRYRFGTCLLANNEKRVNNNQLEFPVSANFIFSYSS
jgi:hypothetical protein